MTAHSRFVAAVALTAAAGMTGLVLAQGTGTPPPAQGQQPTTQTPPAAPAGQGQRGAGQAGRQGGGGRRGGFTQFTRQLAPQDVLVRGKALYEANCASCHAADLRGGAERHEPAALGHRAERPARRAGRRRASPSTSRRSRSSRPTQSRSPNTSTAFTRRWADRAARPDAIPTNVELNVLVGDAKAGEAYFANAVRRRAIRSPAISKASARSIPMPRALQNALGRRVERPPSAAAGAAAAAAPAIP